MERHAAPQPRAPQPRAPQPRAPQSRAPQSCATQQSRATQPRHARRMVAAPVAVPTYCMFYTPTVRLHADVGRMYIPRRGSRRCGCVRVRSVCENGEIVTRTRYGTLAVSPGGSQCFYTLVHIVGSYMGPRSFNQAGFFCRLRACLLVPNAHLRLRSAAALIVSNLPLLPLSLPRMLPESAAHHAHTYGSGR